MIYDPNNELTDEQLSQLSEDEFFEYLDTKAEHLSQFTRPLGTYHTKRYASLSAATNGRGLTQDEYDSAKRIGKEGDDLNNQRVVDRLNKYLEKDNGRAS